MSAASRGLAAPDAATGTNHSTGKAVPMTTSVNDKPATTPDVQLIRDAALLSNAYDPDVAAAVFNAIFNPAPKKQGETR